jgi:hypothetical protein
MTARHTIQGHEVSLPCIVREATSGATTFLVNARAAQAMLPGDSYEVVELLPGKALLSLAIIDYKVNDLGDYNEVSIAFMVRERGASKGIPYLSGWIDLLRGNLKTFIHWLPVNQTFTREAGAEIWGFPKTVEDIEFTYEDRRATCRLVADGRHVLTLSVPRGGNKTMPDNEMATYTYIHGVPHVCGFTSGSDGFGISFSGAELELGNHPYAESLRALGLPKRPMMATWMEKMHGRFDAPEKL